MVQVLVPVLLALLFSGVTPLEAAVKLRGSIVDAGSGQPLPVRLYIQSKSGDWFFARSSSKEGSAVEYRKQRGPSSTEMHTTLSAHPFEAELPPGDYTITVERGKEYLSQTLQVTIENKPLDLEIKLKRWINMARRGWYSGETHVHRSLKELPNVMLAEDLNVTLPLTHWVTKSHIPPSRGDKNSDAKNQAELIKLDPTHVIYPLNTEYEIFSVGSKRHTLGAVFILNHKKPLEMGTPPVLPIAEEARKQNAILDLDKHSWNWSMMIVPIMNVDLFELANNHVWRTQFAFTQWTFDTNPEYLNLETNDKGFTERGWIDYGLGNYYGLLNCGFRMRPTAGTASGVHPVPLGFGRVYVQLKEGFSYDKWISGLNAGRTFITTGPMLFTKINNKPPGHTFKKLSGRSQTCHISGSAESARPLDRIEIIVNGEIQKRITPKNGKTKNGGYFSSIDETLSLDGSSWVAVRCYEPRPHGKFRYAHSAPVYFDVTGHPLRPRRAEVRYFITRMEEEIVRNKDLLQPEELDEYRRARDIYKSFLKTAR